MWSLVSKYERDFTRQIEYWHTVISKSTLGEREIETAAMFISLLPGMTGGVSTISLLINLVRARPESWQSVRSWNLCQRDCVFYGADILIKAAVFSEVIYPELCQCRTEDQPELYFTLKATCSLSHVRGCSGCRVYERASPGSKDDPPP